MTQDNNIQTLLRLIETEEDALLEHEYDEVREMYADAMAVIATDPDGWELQLAMIDIASNVFPDVGYGNFIQTLESDLNREYGPQEGLYEMKWNMDEIDEEDADEYV